MQKHFFLLQILQSSDLFLLIFTLVLVILFLVIIFWFQWHRQHLIDMSPYTGLPLRYARDLPEQTKIKVLRFLYKFQQYDNSLFDLDEAAICRETGRIFSNCVTWYGAIKVDWDFIQKRYSGHFISWGSVSKELQEEIKLFHQSLEGFQVTHSSPQRRPSSIEEEFAWAKPGPLYVDLNTKVLLGWKCVPETDLEVMIVQHPIPR